jgi:Leucine-rich repeat (LRR) protein
LNVSSFLDLSELQILNLQSTNLTDIGFGLFTHQKKLEQLDLSYNRLGSLDLSTLTTLKALTALFIEGNGLESIDFDNIKAILPNLKVFGFTDNPWSCQYLSKLLASVHANTIEVYHLVTEKMSSNVEGIACNASEKGNDRMNYENKSPSVKSIKHQLVNHDNKMREISEKFDLVLRHVNETSQKFVTKTELINEINLLKNLLATLKQEKYNGSFTTFDIKRVANDTLSKALMLQKSDYDEKINVLKLKLERFEQSIDEIRSQLKASHGNVQEYDADGKQQFTKFQSPPTSDDLSTKLHFVMITVIFVIVCGFTIIYVAKLISRRSLRKFMVRRACSESETINENIL